MARPSPMSRQRRLRPPRLPRPRRKIRPWRSRSWDRPAGSAILGRMAGPGRGRAGGPAPAPAPAAPPGPPADYGPPITNEQAKTVAAAALAEAKKNNWRMAFAIVGPAGELVYFEKMDGTQLASVEISQGKARTARLFRRPGKGFAGQYAAGNKAFTTFPAKPAASRGGLPD